MTNHIWKIDDNYEIRSMSEEDFFPIFQKHSSELFKSETQMCDLRSTLSDLEKSKLKNLSDNMGKPFELRLGVFHKDKFIGWHYGRQYSYTEFYMQNSAIFPEHRRKGLYNELIRRVLTVTTEMGFQRVWSRHNATNNAVIIPKLQQGFIVTAMEVTNPFGTLIHLSYFSKEIQNRVMNYRVGQIKPDQEIKNLIGI